MCKYLAVIVCILFCPVAGFSQSPEVPDETFPDIAAVFADPQSPTGATIIYNPIICASIGEACVFFRYHEHGHVYLGHHRNPSTPPVIRERDADNYAAANAPPSAVLTAWHLFMNGGSSSNWHTYGTPIDRARRLCSFAWQAGNWIGPLPC
ncbi:hypothetical protein BC777_0106 [Yoonia maricola]|uniref:Uncharacterized protein n=1 Tax=Yoonia maricola TaxID=420999 RepID=A0A2M8WK21_9RHOB|nr:hypothetical protein BC777_0106 [Yoonia maricola]